MSTSPAAASLGKRAGRACGQPNTVEKLRYWIPTYQIHATGPSTLLSERTQGSISIKFRENPFLSLNQAARGPVFIL